MRAIVVIPTYNERTNIDKIVTRILTAHADLDILIVDDNSPDGTGQIADELAGDWRGRLSVLHRERKEGLGRAYIAGFSKALTLDYDVIVQMDCDLSHDPAYLPALLDHIADSDVVLGSRYIQGINVVNWDFKRLVMSKLASKYVQFITRMPYTDPTGGFKCWRAPALRAILSSRVFASGYVFQVEMTYRAHKRGFRIAEEPIIFYERRVGVSKMNWPIIFEAVWGVLRLPFIKTTGGVAGARRGQAEPCPRPAAVDSESRR
ncbi:MAG TPA: polyprenol monophosphomannose synthase [Bryobacteraceae bacterium]|nr:polyprenol monophosphomannose synthase [Bryobacteraceae bacterium]